MANSADPDQKPTDLDLHCLQRQDISGFSRTRVKKLDQQMTYLMVFMRCFFSSDFLNENTCYGFWFELHRQVDEIQMGSRKRVNAFIKK